jgi:hypothetical protein
MGGESLPHPGHQSVQGGLAAQVRRARTRILHPHTVQAACHVRLQSQRAHEMFLIKPTTFPSTRTSRLRIGSIDVFSGCRRTWSDS